jgi:hypothetical protein
MFTALACCVLWVEQSVVAHGPISYKQFPSMRDMGGMGFPRMRFPKFPKLTAQDFAGGTVRTFCSFTSYIVHLPVPDSHASFSVLAVAHEVSFGILMVFLFLCVCV